MIKLTKRKMKKKETFNNWCHGAPVYGINLTSCEGSFIPIWQYPSFQLSRIVPVDDNYTQASFAVMLKGFTYINTDKIKRRRKNTSSL
jgi:hypothetical protein